MSAQPVHMILDERILAPACGQLSLLGPTWLGTSTWLRVTCHACLTREQGLPRLVVGDDGRARVIGGT